MSAGQSPINGLCCPFTVACTIPLHLADGLGENVAEAIVKARQGGPFISMEDLRTRGKVNTSAMEKLKALGCLDNMSESNQLSLF